MLCAICGFLFVIPQLSSSSIDPNICIMKLGVREFELQRKVYADNAKISKPTNATVDEKEEEMPFTESSNVMYTDVTAAVYKEWNVIKKNKFGRFSGVE